MRKFQNKSILSLAKASQAEAPTYIDIMKQCLNEAPEGGFTLADVRRRMKILDSIDAQLSSLEEGIGKSDVVFEFEDADAEVMVQCVRSAKWGKLHREVIEFVDHVEEQLKWRW